MADNDSTSSATAYRVLARKYRPQTFAEVIGQEAMVRTLSNAIAEGRIAQAFMLTGVRGIGKTTTARIIARALNCIGADGSGGATTSPCGECVHCRSIAEDRHVEDGVDGVHHVRDAVLPAQGRDRVRRGRVDPRGDVPLVGGRRPKFMRVAAEKADIWQWDGPIERYRPPYELLVANCAEIGRDLGSIRLSTSGEVYLPVDAADFPAMAAVFDDPVQAPTGVIMGEPDWVIGPTPDDAVRALMPMVELGVSHFTMYFWDRRSMQRFADEPRDLNPIPAQLGDDLRVARSEAYVEELHEESVKTPLSLCQPRRAVTRTAAPRSGRAATRATPDRTRRRLRRGRRARPA